MGSTCTGSSRSTVRPPRRARRSRDDHMSTPIPTRMAGGDMATGTAIPPTDTVTPTDLATTAAVTGGAAIPCQGQRRRRAWRLLPRANRHRCCKSSSSRPSKEPDHRSGRGCVEDSQPLAGRRDRQRGAVDADPAPPEPLGHDQRGTRTAAGIEHQLPWPARGQDDSLEQRLGLLRRVARSLPRHVIEGRNAPVVRGLLVLPLHPLGSRRNHDRREVVTAHRSGVPKQVVVLSGPVPPGATAQSVQPHDVVEEILGAEDSVHEHLEIVTGRTIAVQVHRAGGLQHPVKLGQTWCHHHQVREHWRWPQKHVHRLERAHELCRSLGPKHLQRPGRRIIPWPDVVEDSNLILAKMVVAAPGHEGWIEIHEVDRCGRHLLPQNVNVVAEMESALLQGREL